MAAKDSKDEVEWELDWDDLTAGAEPSPAPAPPNVVSPGNRAFPTPANPLPTPEPELAIPPQRLPSASTQPTDTHSSPAATPPPVPTDPAQTLVRGQRLRLAEILPGNPPAPFEAVLTLSATQGLTFDLCCFGLDEAGQLSDDRYFVFYNQQSSPEGALRVRDHGFRVDLGRLPATVRRLAFTATVDGAGTVRALGLSRFELRTANGQTVAAYAFSGSDLEEVRALMVADVYFKDGWRLAAVGQGFAGGLSELLHHFGGQEI